MRGRNIVQILKAVDMLSQPGGTTINNMSTALEIDRRSVYRVLDIIPGILYSDSNDGINYGQNIFAIATRRITMINYIRGLCRLRKISFNIQECQDEYYLKYALSAFLKAEGKEVRSLNTGQTVIPLPMVKRRIVSKLPQFSEAIHRQMLVIRAGHDAKLSKERVISKKYQTSPERIEFDELVLAGKNASLKYNHALILTCPGKIPGMDR